MIQNKVLFLEVRFHINECVWEIFVHIYIKWETYVKDAKLYMLRLIPPLHRFSTAYPFFVENVLKYFLFAIQSVKEKKTKLQQ